MIKVQAFDCFNLGFLFFTIMSFVIAIIHGIWDN